MRENGARAPVGYAMSHESLRPTQLRQGLLIHGELNLVASRCERKDNGWPGLHAGDGCEE